MPTEPVEFTRLIRIRDTKSGTINLFLPPGEKKGTRRAISEIGQWLNYVTGGRFLTMAADLSGSINVEKSHFFGHYDPVQIQEELALRHLFKKL
ncbi:MAG: hypothetical protein CM1200mP14_25690 [Gammaproteobacteria bacterium]|nr:MAG: hypothetical protein CM1200mP14_25690 [Gammaproteobacteria bacterium]